MSTLALALPPARLTGRLRVACTHPVTWVWVTVLLLVLPQPWHQLNANVDPIIDLHVYRDAALSLLHGDPLYSHYTVTRYSVLPFTYPPLAAVLALPLTVLPLLVVGALWMAGCYLALFVVLRIVLVPVREQLREWLPAAEPYLLPLAWLAGSYLVVGRQQVHYGQVGYFLMLAICVDLLTKKTGRWQGILVGLATAVKLTPGVFIIGLFLAGRRQAAGMAAASFALISGLLALFAPHESRNYWFGALFDSDRLGNNADVSNQSLRGMVLRTSLAGRGATAVFVVLALVIAAVGFTKAVRAWRAGDELMAVTLVGLLMALLSPVAWIHHFVFVVPLLALLARDHRWKTLLGLGALWMYNWAISWQHVVVHHQWTFLGSGRTLLESTLGISAALVVLLLPAAPRRRGGPSGVAVARAPERVAALLP